MTQPVYSYISHLENKSICPHKHLCRDVYCGFIYNGSKKGTTQIFINRRMAK